MSGSSHESVVSWEPSPKGDPPTNTTRQAHYWRSVGWAIAGWVVAAVVVSLVGEVLQLRELAGWAALAGVIVGGWFGGVPWRPHRKARVDHVRTDSVRHPDSRDRPWVMRVRHGALRLSGRDRARASRVAGSGSRENT